MEAEQKNYPQQDRCIEVYEKHIGINAEHEYTPTQKDWVLAAMREYAQVYIDVGVKKDKLISDIYSELREAGRDGARLETRKNVLEESLRELIDWIDDDDIEEVFSDRGDVLIANAREVLKK